MPNNRVPLTFALPSYDHVYPLTSGEVNVEGVNATYIDLATPVSLDEFVAAGDWDVTDVPAAEYLARRLAGENRVVALPVFTSRMFGHSCIYVRKERIPSPEALRGARVGTTEWSTTGCVYARGVLSDMYGVQAADMSWTHADESSGTLAEMMDAGSIDAVIAPESHWRRGPGGDSAAAVGRLFDRLRHAEQAYFAQTAVFPIDRIVAVRQEALDQHRWLATNIYRAFEVARRRYFARLDDIKASRVPIPSVTGHLASIRELLGADIWPYGVEANRVALETLARYATEQGVIAVAPADVADLFVPVEPFVDGA